MIDIEFFFFFDIIWSFIADLEEKESHREGRPKFLSALIDLLVREPQIEAEAKKRKRRTESIKR